MEFLTGPVGAAGGFCAGRPDTFAAVTDWPFTWRAFITQRYTVALKSAVAGW